VVVTVAPLGESGRAVFVDEEYVSLLTALIRGEWASAKTRRQLVRPVTIELVLGSDGGIQSVSVTSKTEPSDEGVGQASAALESVLNAHRGTLTGAWRLYTEEEGVRRTCFSCTAKLIVTFKPSQ
jgi:hypothetical protein